MRTILSEKMAGDGQVLGQVIEAEIVAGIAECRSIREIAADLAASELRRRANIQRSRGDSSAFGPGEQDLGDLLAS